MNAQIAVEGMMNRFYRFLLSSVMLIGLVVFAVGAEKDNENYTQWGLPKAAKARFGKGGINAIRFSPDGTQIAVGTSIGVWIYDINTGKEIDMLPGMAQTIAFSPDGRFIASGGGKFWASESRLWETGTGRQMSFIEALHPASALQFSEDGKTLFTLEGWAEAIGTLDVETGKVDVKKIEDRSWEKITSRISPEPYALTHDKFAVGSQLGKIELWDTTTGQKLSTLLAIQDNNLDQPFFDPIGGVHVLILEFSPDGSRLASGSKDKTVQLWDTDTHEELAILQKHTGWINALAFSSDGKRLASGGTDKMVNLWDTDTGELIATFTGHLNGVVALSFSPDGSTLASGSADGAIKFWNTETKDLLPVSITDHAKWFKAVSFTEGNSGLVSVAFNGIIDFWDLNISQKTGSQDAGHNDLLQSSALSPDGTKLASVGVKATMFFEAGGSDALTLSTQMEGQRIQLTETRTGRELADLNAADNVMNVMNPGDSSMVFSPDGKTVAFDSPGKIYVWNTETGDNVSISLIDGENIPGNLINADGNGGFGLPPGARIEHIMPSITAISALAFSPDGRKLISGGMGGKVQMWDAETGVALAPFLQGQDMEETVKGGPNNFTVRFSDIISALVFSSDSALLAVGSKRKTRLLGSSKQPRLKDGPYGATSLAFSPDDTVLLAGLRTGGIELWDLATGEKLSTLNGHTQPVETLVFSPDGKTLVSTGQDGTILVWDWDEAVK